jgi:outer membrane lipoprotein-sorting protein
MSAGVMVASRCLLPLAAAFALAAPALPVAARPVTLADVEAALAATRTMTADFTQVAGNGQAATGRMVIRRPGQARFDYGPPSRILVVADGRTLSFVDYRVRQVSQWPIRATPLGVLLDPKADLARIARVLPESESPVPGTIAVLAEDPARPEFGRITFLLERRPGAPGGLMLAGWRVVDAQNNLTAVSLGNVQWNVDVAGTRFGFEDPRRRPGAPGRPG